MRCPKCGTVMGKGADVEKLLWELIEKMDSRMNKLEGAVEAVRNHLGHYDKAKLRLKNYNKKRGRA